MIECDCCMEHGDPDYHCEEDPAHPEAQKLGWSLSEDGKNDLCPSCLSGDCQD